jgi:hypothetical protein
LASFQPFYIHVRNLGAGKAGKARNGEDKKGAEEINPEPNKVIGGLAGLAFGAIIGWLSFESAFGGVGIGIALAMGICGAFVAYGFEQDK